VLVLTTVTHFRKTDYDFANRPPREGYFTVLGILFLLFVVIPLVELLLLVTLAHYTSLIFTIVVVLLTGAIGSYLARQQGWQTYRRIQNELNHGQMPTASLLDAAMILVAGVLLITPGILTDVTGFALLIPYSRRILGRYLALWIKAKFSLQAFPAHDSDPQGPSAGNGCIIDSHIVDSSEDD